MESYPKLTLANVYATEDLKEKAKNDLNPRGENTRKKSPQVYMDF